MDSGSSGDQDERFARALSSADPDPDFETELAIVAALRTLGPGIAPDDLARERMRKRVLVKASPAVSSRRGRFAVALVAALALVLALGGMSLLLSRDALPGDALYGVKRTAEAATLGLTFGDESKALKHLEFANARVGEMETLAQRHPDPADAPVGGYLTALTDFDADTTQASRQLIALATRGELQQLESLRAWVAQQTTRLAALGPRLPVSVQQRTTTSRQLLDKIAERSTLLLGRADCYQITTGGSDDIGAIPATGLCHRDTASSAPTVSTGPTSTQQQPRVKTPETPPPPAPEESKAPVVPTPPVEQTVPQVPLLPVPVPSAPVQPSAPSQPQLPIPILELPPLLPGLPAIRIG
ncbi:hypothetical protein JOF56_002702 [Kibdelosporangium banguiense]|uniref:DUF5667 domain-containing protein n=1 Tax=Kibdelosporangium banguiense TaxID=1365924 RepID=A0ABS4TD20_9PSEU|nr:DUF5667 domain-containing protein [Kibdelosporangium banguiense]MBP2322317.1 hypothetical protein [Kibdelosporangium banguiense]